MKHENNTEAMEEYYGSLKELFNVAGWKTLCTDLGNSFKVINDVQTVKDSDDLFFRKGQLAMMANIINLPEQVKNLEEHNAEIDDDQED